MHLNYLPKSFSMKLAMRQDWWGNNLICGCCCCCEWNEEGPSLQLQEVSLQHTSLFLGRHTHKWDERKYSSVKAKHSGNKWARDKNDWRFCGTHHDTSKVQSISHPGNERYKGDKECVIYFLFCGTFYLSFPPLRRRGQVFNWPLWVHLPLARPRLHICQEQQ